MNRQKRILTAALIAVWIALAGTWVATQYFASLVQYDRVLGRPLTVIDQTPIYTPFKYFEWHSKAGKVVPELFDRASNILYISYLLAFVAFALVGRKPKKLDSHGTATWATEEDIKKSGLLDKQGIILGKTEEGYYLRHDGPEHVIVMAPTRSGKGVGIILPTLLTWAHSVLVTDIKGENWGITSGFRKKYLKNKVLKFDPTALTGSVKYNPLDEVRLKTPNEVRDVQNIADMLVDPQGTGQLDHWAKTGHALLVGVTLHLLYMYDKAGKTSATLADIAAFLSNPNKSFEETLEEMMNAEHADPAILQQMYQDRLSMFNDGDDDDESSQFTHPIVAQAARELLNKSENERSGLLSTAMSFLGLYRDPIIAENTSRSEFKIADLMNYEQPVSLYLVVPPSDIDRTRPLIRMILNLVVRRLTEEMKFEHGRPVKGYKHRLLLLMDEFPALGNLETFEAALAFVAGYGLKALLIVQSLNQLYKKYTKENSIVDNCHIRVFYTPNDPTTPEYVTKMLGKTTIKVKSMSGTAGGVIDKSQSTSEIARDLMTPSEVALLRKEEELIFVTGFPPIKAKKIFYYEDQNFMKRCMDAPNASDYIPSPVVNSSQHNDIEEVDNDCDN